MIKIALIQQTAFGSKTENLKKGMAAIEKAAKNGAQLAVFAELAFERFYPQFPAKADHSKLAETLDGEIVTTLRKMAATYNMVIIPNFYEMEGENTFDTSPVINADGTLMGKTQMVHIPDYQYFHEKTYYTPGNHNIRIYETSVGKIGIAICYDRHYPEYMRALAVAGAELVVIPQAGAVGEWTDGLYEAEMQIAAFQNGYFTALCNRVGKENNLTFSGESFVCDPNGKLIAQAGSQTEEILYCDIDLEMAKHSSARKLFLPDRRPGIYSRWIQI